MTATFCVVRLGNPGAQYNGTRHNIGYAVLDLLAGRLETTPWQRAKRNADECTAPGGLVLLKPRIAMNCSGIGTKRALKRHAVTLGRMLVIHDDMDVPFGEVAVQLGGLSGGHGGLGDIMRECGADFARIRVGIGRDVDVVGRFELHEQARLVHVLHAATDAVLRFAHRGGAHAVQV